SQEEEQDSAPPTAADRPGASSPTSDSSTPTDPGTATDDPPSSTPEYDADQKEAAALAVLMTSLFAHGVSDGEVGISPAEARAEAEASGAGSAADEADGSSSADSDDASDGGGDELAETGTEASTPAALAGLTLLGGAGLLWHQRRRRD
ncbi:MAG: LPXTG cell wall anchor domain-containing protein, partial [Brachybacterium sp.]|nr:LPXTG cell wall anchor domain-containing protein [Brachybacterium sp.]